MHARLAPQPCENSRNRAEEKQIRKTPSPEPVLASSVFARRDQSNNEEYAKMRCSRLTLHRRQCPTSHDLLQRTASLCSNPYAKNARVTLQICTAKCTASCGVADRAASPKRARERAADLRPSSKASLKLTQPWFVKLRNLNKVVREE